jgi:signal transduction histidine kinase
MKIRGPGVDLDRVGIWERMWRADQCVLGLGAPYLRVIATCRLQTNTRIVIVIRQRSLVQYLRHYAVRTAFFSMAVALITAGLIYATLDRLLVRPMQIMTANIVAFRRDPEYARLSGLKWLGGKGDDEVARAARELVAMQDDLRTALWRNAQLAALGTAVAKIGHDLRNILASALLVAERFQGNLDPVIKQAANTLIPSIERAVELVNRAVVEGGGPPPVTRALLALRELVDEAADSIRQGHTGIGIDNLVPGSLVLPLDKNQIYRVLTNLMRNAVQAGASHVTLTAEDEAGVAQLVVADNGPGLPRKTVAGLFQPFTGSSRNGGTGLGLAIARDLVRAHGGDLLLRRTGPAGTEFVMSLPTAVDGALEHKPTESIG